MKHIKLDLDTREFYCEFCKERVKMFWLVEIDTAIEYMKAFEKLHSKCGG